MRITFRGKFYEKNYSALFCRMKDFVIEYHLLKIVGLFVLEIKILLQKLKKSHVKCMGK